MSHSPDSEHYSKEPGLIQEENLPGDSLYVNSYQPKVWKSEKIDILKNYYKF